MSRIARKTQRWIETIIALALALLLLVLVAAGAYYVLVVM